MKVKFLEVRNLNENDPMLLQPAPSVREYEDAYEAIGSTLLPTPIHPLHSVWIVDDKAFHDQKMANIYAKANKFTVTESSVMTLSSPFVEDPGSLVGTTADVLYTYRGGFLWITDGHTIHRPSPIHGYINQYTTTPVPGDIEDVRLNLNGRPFHARVEFN
jgi:hypothetical protein